MWKMLTFQKAPVYYQLLHPTQGNKRSLGFLENTLAYLANLLSCIITTCIITILEIYHLANLPSCNLPSCKFNVLQFYYLANLPSWIFTTLQMDLLEFLYLGTIPSWKVTILENSSWNPWLAIMSLGKVIESPSVF